MIKKAIIAAAAAIIIITGLMYGYIEWYGRTSEPRPADVLIVLGAAVWSGGPSPALLERVSLAQELYQNGYARAIITTGGAGSLNPVPEGAAARNVLLAAGVPAGAVYAETRSRNTRDNLAEAHKIMRQNGWRRAIIVTHDYHLLRAIREAERLGIEADGAGVHQTAMFRPPLVLREVLANIARTFT